VKPEAPSSLLPRTPTPPVAPSQAPGERRFRPDIQGLRAVAVLLVVLYHAGVPGVSGGYVGVDVFFVISGFLITGQLVRELQQTGRISFTRFYANRIRRLLPPAVLVLVVTIVVARLTGSLLRFADSALDTVFTAGYLINYRLADQGVNYQNAAALHSPLQHFWSLAVEEQFYLLWPILLVACAWLTRRQDRRTRLIVITGLLVVIGALSFLWSIRVTGSNAPMAYFSLQTRAWELALGALVAIGAARLSRLPAGLAAAGSWIGLALIVVTGFVYTEHTPFPGSAAALPVLGSALVIIAGCRPTKGTRQPVRGSAEHLLALRPLQAVGTVSYGWYLWHWPVIVLAPRILGVSPTWPQKLGLMVLALGVSALSYWLIETPARRSRQSDRRWIVAGLSGSAGVAALATVLLITMPALIGAGRPVQAPDLDQNGTVRLQQALQAADRATDVPENLFPTLELAAEDAPGTSFNDCHLDYLDTDPPPCVYGDPAGKRTVVLVGDSHAEQWFPALDLAARDQGWRLISWTKAACSIADVPQFSDVLRREFTECLAWRESITARILAVQPDLVISSQSNIVPDARTDDQAWAAGTARALARFQQADIPVTYLGDSPSLRQNAPDCVADHLADVGACSTPRTIAAPAHGRAEELRSALTAADVTVVEPADWFCTATSCPVVVGNLLVYRDGSHFSRTYSRYLAPLLQDLLRP
jgi:peptidoglycan/LPS O-acetylase OafA/YrhL